MPPTPQPARAWRADGLDMSRNVWISWPISWDDEWWMNHFDMVNGGLLNGGSTIPPTDLRPLIPKKKALFQPLIRTIS